MCSRQLQQICSRQLQSRQLQQGMQPSPWPCSSLGWDTSHAHALSPRQLCCCQPCPCRICWVVRALMHTHTLGWLNQQSCAACLGNSCLLSHRLHMLGSWCTPASQHVMAIPSRTYPFSPRAVPITSSSTFRLHAIGRWCAPARQDTVGTDPSTVMVYMPTRACPAQACSHSPRGEWSHGYTLPFSIHACIYSRGQSTATMLQFYLSDDQ